MKGCEFGYHKSCYNAAMLDMLSPTPDPKLPPEAQRKKVAPDPAKAVYFLKKACEEGDVADACHRLVNFLLHYV